MRNAYLDHVAIDDIDDALYSIHQNMWTLKFDRELSDAERVEKLKSIAEQAKELAKIAKALHKDFSYNVAVLSD